MNALKNKKTAVLGLGKSGMSAVRLLLREGASVLASDSDPSLKIDRRPFNGLPLVCKLGAPEVKDFQDADLIVASPGVPNRHPLLVKARKKGIPVIGEMELAFRFLNPEILFAITGTNGKSTATTLLGEFFKKAGKKTFVGGNLGIPASEAVLSSPAGGWEAVVLEVSSFQLETIRDFHPSMAAVLNITPDHGERYANLEDYARAKFKIFLNQTGKDYAFLNRDDPQIRNFPFSAKSAAVWFSLKDTLSEGIFVKDHFLWFRRDGSEVKIADLKAIPLKGDHNLENVMVSAGMAFLSGVPLPVVQEVLDDFKGLEHRLERVRDLHGVSYINDSKGTNVGAVIRSLEHVDGPVVLIAGGKEKGGGFLPLVPLIQKKVKALVLIGEAKSRMKEEFHGITEILEAGTLKEAVQKASRVSRTGDTVLLSPACSSYDMFRDYEERGRMFKKYVGELM